ncbi:MAG: hypothetical protein M1420_04830 [Actinobacteria bacterium]|nr:hypothetical protein [Actinomycetota bacterium]
MAMRHRVTATSHQLIEGWNGEKDGSRVAKVNQLIGLRRPVERTNSWMENSAGFAGSLIVRRFIVSPSSPWQ